MIDSLTMWFEVTQYSNKKAMIIADLAETKLLFQYPWPVEIMYDQGEEFPSHNFKNILIEN